MACRFCLLGLLIAMLLTTQCKSSTFPAVQRKSCTQHRVDTSQQQSKATLCVLSCRLAYPQDCPG